MAPRRSTCDWPARSPITTAGRRAFAEWVDREPAREQPRVPLLLTIQFAEHLPPDRLREIIAGPIQP